MEVFSEKELQSDARPTQRLCRGSVAGIVRALREGEQFAKAWNIVEALELLIDAGQFAVASSLALQVADLVKGDGRERLFQAYAVLCRLMIDGDQSECIVELERLYVEIHNGGHSIADKVRIGLLLSRATAVCVSVGSLSQGAILRVRNVIGVELDRVAESGDYDLHCQVVVELAKSYLHAPTPDARAALSILREFMEEPAFAQVSPPSAFDLRRALFQADRAAQRKSELQPDDLRREAQGLGAVERALAELTIARGQPEIDSENLGRVAEVFIENGFLSGAYESLFMLASWALDRGYNMQAGRLWRRALEVADMCGFLHGRLLAASGMFQCELAAGNMDEALVWCEVLREGIRTELALGSSGLNLAAIEQMLGDHSAAMCTAKRCEVFFKAQGLSGFQAQAAHIVGLCQARNERWDEARRCWGRAALLEDKRNAFVLASERRGFVVQAQIMHDVTTVGHLRPETVTRTAAVLAKAERDLQPFNEQGDALRVRARLRVVQAHVDVMLGEHLTALRNLSIARGLFEVCGLEHDVAMADAFAALSMIEMGKKGNPSLLEEAVMHLQHALQVFAVGTSSAIRWKLLYYMAVSSVMIGQSKSSQEDRLKWRELAISWLRGAEKEHAQVVDGAGQETEATEFAQFSPTLKQGAIDELKEVLGLTGRAKKRGEKPTKSTDLTTDRYLH